MNSLEPSKCTPIHLESKPSCKNNRFTRAALDLIRKSEYDPEIRFKHAAVIVSGGKILGLGINTYSSHPMASWPIKIKQSKRDLEHVYTLHAEMNAIRSVKNKESLRHATIYVARLSDQFGTRMSCPCESCQFYIRKYGIRKVVYSTDSSTWNEVKIK